ncbi:MAG: YdeI/OmpD-associated family protein [Bacteroidetes Order II. Incertae sedis bacterium]|nr:YdeI/OmpD-associated family protein [Bacteroidetes Order II. bacterium]
MYSNPQVDLYFEEGCGRCPLAATPECKVHKWPHELALLRTIVRHCGLAETRKWGVPCYTHEGKNIVLISALKECCVLSFFKGALLRDEAGLLQKPGDQSQAARIIRFTHTQQILAQENILKAYLYEAIGVEKANLSVPLKSIEAYDLPEELINRFQAFPDLEVAFRALTPGRQRGYLIHFSAPKQTKTREARIDKYIHKILEGKGIMD